MWPSLESKILSAIMRRVQTKYCCHMFKRDLVVRTNSNARGMFIMFYIYDGILTVSLVDNDTTAPLVWKVIAKHEIANPKFDVSAMAKFIIAKLDEMRALRR